METTMGPTAVFKGGSMNGTEITYQECYQPEDGETTIINMHQLNMHGYDCAPKEVYIFALELNSWVYDHQSEVVETDGE